MTKIHGHRGCSGLMPENAIAGFLDQKKLAATKPLLSEVVEMVDIKRMVELKPDGVITDFPTRVVAAIKT